ncbi:heavy-metal-associated domain-containing protein [Arthrospiribacter ruber]|uniref:Heavy-metal-associated domain-containing protein n=1 Tax=Arthrospiribacter ruber TaxID=2487934 RepID=A0A951IWC4_9BACT|nr:heavy metal-associated domain-containing protein [Arthrospiribacter ruber]MBW3468440.1 heavy-metal-associated domain-containing protein [Arthrospiribacter ruber]
MIKRILLGAIFLMLFLIGTLAVHIYMVTKPKSGAIPSLTMSRFDFPSSLEETTGESIKEFLKNQEGIKDVRVNFSNGHVICLYDRQKHSPHDLVLAINNELMQEASLYQPSDEMLAQSCPAIDKNSLTYKLGAFFQKSFHN